MAVRLQMVALNPEGVVAPKGGLGRGAPIRPSVFAGGPRPWSFAPPCNIGGPRPWSFAPADFSCDNGVSRSAMA